MLTSSRVPPCLATASALDWDQPASRPAQAPVQAPRVGRGPLYDSLVEPGADGPVPPQTCASTNDDDDQDGLLVDAHSIYRLDTPLVVRSIFYDM
jgi:hypothetical protein